MLNAPLRILIVAGVCLLALIGLVVREGAARDGGEEVLLAMEAVDPRALLSGHYVMIRLQESLPEGEVCPAGVTDQGMAFVVPSLANDTTWVSLKARGEHFSVAALSADREGAEGVSAIVAQGTAACWQTTATEEVPAQSVITLQLNGIDRFYINQTEAERIDRILRDQGDTVRAFAIVSIAGDGRARLRGLMVDGERLELNWF
ncbi:MAG: GDYXXLXY domain-containing protein [Terricaulis sp.]